MLDLAIFGRTKNKQKKNHAPFYPISGNMDIPEELVSLVPVKEFAGG